MNQEVKTINGYNIKDEKAIRTYDSVASMKADTKLNEGQYVKTRGYYEINDGGSAEYIIKSNVVLNEYKENLNNGLYATLIAKDSVNVKQFGAKGDGITDDKTAIQNALDYTQNKELYFDNSTYCIGNYLSLTDNIIIGNDTIIRVLSNFNDNYMAIPHNEVTIKNIKFDCNDECICCLGSTTDNTKLIIDNCIFTGTHENTNENSFALNSSAYLCAKEMNITNSKFINNKSHGARLKTAYENTNVNIDNCEFSYNGIQGEIVAVGLVQYGGEEGTYYEKVTIQNCFAEHNANTGIAPHSTNNVIVSKCVSNNNGEHGFCIMDSKSSEISNCIAKNNRKYGIRIQGDYNTSDSYTGCKDFIVSNNYLVGSGIDIDNNIQNGIISNNLIKYAESTIDETSKGIRIGKVENQTDTVKNINFINNKIDGYNDSIISFVELYNDCNFKNYINGVLEENYKHGSNYFKINTLNNKKYGTTNAINENYNDFSGWSLGNGVTRNGNTFTTSGTGGFVLCYKSFNITEMPKYLSTYLSYQSNNRIVLSVGVRFRKSDNTLIQNSTIDHYTNTPNNELGRIFDLSDYNLSDTPGKIEVVIAINNVETLTLNKCLIALSSEIPIFPNIK